MLSVEVVPRRFQGTRCVRSLSAVLLVAALGVLAGCQREAPTELGPATAAAEPTPPPPPPAAPSRITPEMVAAADAIDGDDVRAVVAEIADDRYMGRSPGSPGDKMTRAYLEKELAKRGFAPGGEGGSWEQPVELVGVTAAAPAKWTFDARTPSMSRSTATPISSRRAACRRRARRSTVRRSCSSATASRRPSTSGTTSRASTSRARCCVMLNNDPDWDPALFAGTDPPLLRPLGLQIRERAPSWRGRRDHHPHDAVRGLSMAGGAGVLGRRAVRAARGRRAAHPDRGVGHRGRDAAHARGRRARSRFAGGAGEAARLQARAARTSRRRSRFDNRSRACAVGQCRGPAARHRPEARRRARGFLRASRSPRRRRAGRSKPGDRIYNGAATTPPAVAQVLAIARGDRGAAPAPAALRADDVRRRRGAGLARLGILSLHPTVAPGKIAADINYDGGEHLGRTRDITFIGLGKSPRSIAVATAGRGLAAPRAEAGPVPRARLFYRSDQFTFAKIGVPGVVLERRHRLRRTSRRAGAANSSTRTSSATITSRATSSRTNGASMGSCRTRSSASTQA